jgi:hypothetical protein
MVFETSCILVPSIPKERKLLFLLIDNHLITGLQKYSSPSACRMELHQLYIVVQDYRGGVQSL